MGCVRVSSRSFHRSAVVGMGIDDFIEKPMEDGARLQTGRNWTAADLRRKSFEDLHKLWYVLFKERNLLLSLREKHRGAERSLPTSELNRYVSVKRSMAGIKLVLAERRKLQSDADRAAAAGQDKLEEA